MMEIRYSQLCFLPLFLFINGVSLQEPVSVEGFIGGSAVLPCSSKEPPLTVQDIDLVRWRHNYDQNVYEIINGQDSVEEQDPVYRNRVESFPEEYLRGNFSIKLNNLQHTDAGEYTCYIFMKEQVSRIVELSIKERSERQLPSEGTKPRPEMTVMIISALFIGIISSLAVSSHKTVSQGFLHKSSLDKRWNSSSPPFPVSTTTSLKNQTRNRLAQLQTPAPGSPVGDRRRTQAGGGARQSQEEEELENYFIYSLQYRQKVLLDT